ncbi:MAG: DNA mismatch repair protein MutS [Firmicutes bacterium]|nr:DNA mismatch repair protein MutS [Bacillota bacterium]
MAKLTPMMQQYMKIKEQHKDSILFFRLGDFYEMFFDDALVASKELEITLTARECGLKEKAPMCGIPYHSSDNYISKLVEKGFKIAICEQVQDPSTAKGIVKRDVVRIITPGTITDMQALDEKSNNYLCCVYMDNEGLGISYVDITTGELYTTEARGNKEKLKRTLIDELAKITPNEIIVNNLLFEETVFVKSLKSKFDVMINKYHEWVFDRKTASNRIKKQLDVITLEGYGISNNEFSISSTGALIEYLNETQKIALKHLNNINSYSIEKYMVLDINTRRNLEITETLRGKSKKGSLLWLLDKTSTAMGARLLKKWLEEPLLDINKINERLNSVEYLVDNQYILDEIKELFKNVYDIERLVSRIVYGSCNARDLISLRNSIGVLPKLKKILIETDSEDLMKIGKNIDELKEVYDLIVKSIIEEPPVTIKEGGIIKKEYNKELKELKEATVKGKEWLTDLQADERKRTGIKSLKVGFNKVFGYYIEVTKSNIENVPDNYVRKQTLANSERYITPELKEMESRILGSEEKSMDLEYKLFVQIRDYIRKEIKRIQNCAKIISKIDALCSLSQVSYKNNYIKPEINNDGILDIKNGRHPVVEKTLDEELFVPNDTLLDNNNNRLSIITGPNMAGKSTYMRQVAIISLMAQIGCFVPAESATVGLVDRIFTRVGASDDLSQGQSTFMVEMSEVANILNNSTKDSLLILDEIGRGTSTYDGLSIAWAVVEYISNKTKLGAKTLFATHYHELTELEGKLDGVKNYNILVKEKGDDIIFLRKISRGGADKSYGIEVARLAGVPNPVIDRSKEILESLEKRETEKKEIAMTKDTIIKEKEENYDKKEIKKEKSDFQLSFIDKNKEEIIDELKSLDMMETTPLDAINILYSLTKKVKDH